MYCGQMLYVSVFVKYKMRVQESLSSFFLCAYHITLSLKDSTLLKCRQRFIGGTRRTLLPLLLSLSAHFSHSSASLASLNALLQAGKKQAMLCKESTEHVPYPFPTLSHSLTWGMWFLCHDL